jgi:DNA-binding MarR family transcriptional regulator
VSATSKQELATWRAFLRTHALLMRRLETDLHSCHELPLPWYDVLVQLAEAPERRLRMTELANRVLLSRSGLTRLVDRLEQEGLVARAACPGDARAIHAVLTEAGLDRLRQASPTHLRNVDEHFTSRLTPDELDQLGALMAKLGD